MHRGDQAMRELHRVATGLPPELAADLVVSAAPEFVGYSKYAVRHDRDNPAILSSNDKVPVSKPSPAEEIPKPSPDALNPDEVSKPGDEASMPRPDDPASKSSPDASMPRPDDEAPKSGPDPKASVPEFEKYTYLDDLTAWIRRAEIPNPKQDEAIRQLEALVDKS